MSAALIAAEAAVNQIKFSKNRSLREWVFVSLEFSRAGFFVRLDGFRG